MPFVSFLPRNWRQRVTYSQIRLTRHLWCLWWSKPSHLILSHCIQPWMFVSHNSASLILTLGAVRYTGCYHSLCHISDHLGKSKSVCHTWSRRLVRKGPRLFPVLCSSGLEHVVLPFHSCPSWLDWNGHPKVIQSTGSWHRACVGTESSSWWNGSVTSHLLPWNLTWEMQTEAYGD